MCAVRCSVLFPISVFALEKPALLSDIGALRYYIKIEAMFFFYILMILDLAFYASCGFVLTLLSSL